MISKNQEGFLWGALVGGAVGAAAALLLTPYSGAEIRRQVRKGINRVNGSQVQLRVPQKAKRVVKRKKR